MLEKRVYSLTHLWWYDPELPKPPRKPSKHQRQQPVEELAPGQRSRARKPQFKPSKKWINYGSLESHDGGYIVEFYNLAAIGKRYGLSKPTQEVWKRSEILPQPFTLSNVVNVRAHYWSRIQLVVMDAILKHLERNGIYRFESRLQSCMELRDHGCEVLEAYYTEMYERQVDHEYDGFGVKRIGG